MATALNALSKWPGRANCEKAIDVLASRLAKDHDLRQAMDAQHVGISLNALSRCLGRPACQTAGLLLAERAGLAELPWQQFEMRGIAMVANAMSRLLHLDEEQLQTLGGAKLQAMAGHLELHPERFESASVLEIGMLFKALAAARLHRQMRPLARPALERVSVLVGDDRLRETNLEGIGNLCMGLLPLIRSPKLNSRHRGHALRVFNTLQPIVERKIDLYLTGGDSQSSTDIDQHATRYPALTFFQVLKAYSMVSRQWKLRHVEGTRQELRQRRDQLVTWVDRTLERTREAIEADLGEMSWNLIAQIEAGDQTFDALDLRMAKEAPTITQAHPPTSFDLDVGRWSMRSAPGQPSVPANGSTTHVVVDLQGKEVSNNATETNQQYSLFARLTGLPLVEVQLPGAISTFMLARTFNYQGEPWRFDLFGGSRATRGNMSRPAQLLSGTSAAPSLLPAIRYADTAPGSSLMTLVAKLAPQREDWSRMQRSLLEMVPSDHVIEGTLRLGFFEDVSGPAHPFKPLAVDGRPLALCPNDGCGFLKLEVALCIPAFRKHYDAWQAVQAGQASQEQRDLLANDKGTTRLAPQALQHFPRDEAALQEAHEAMRHRLEALPPELSQLTLFELATSGGYQGQRVRAVPSADDKVHLPRERSQAFDAAGGPLLIGKPPYDKENLLPVPEERVAKGDATAEFLSQSFGIQYSYTGFDDRSGDDAQMLHSKGMLIVVPEKNWPADFVNTDLVCSKEDLKTLSCWTAGRDRSAVPRDMISTGSLRLKDIVEPGRMGALPIAELRKRNMDTDGDDAFVYAGYPRLAALIAREMADREDRRGQPQSFKPPKTATPAIDRETGHYKAGRLSEIMSLQRGGQIMGAASTLAARFMAQPDQLREAMARNMMFGTYDGIERDLRTGLREVLEGDARDPQVLAKLRADAGDAIERAHMPEAREAAQLLHAQLLRLDQQVSSADVPQLPDALAETFPNLAKAYVAAPSAEARIHAILDNYPVCRLSHAQFPAGQPGLILDEPELTMRNLFTIAIKVGTDALKSDTGTALFAKIVEACERSERGFAERVRVVPYSKATARAMHDGRFDAEQTKGLLQHMPTMAAGVMQDALHALQQARLIDPPPPPAERLRDVRTEDITLNAKSLLTRARDMEPVVTEMLNRAAVPYGGRLVGTQHQLKSLGSLKEKLKQQMALKKQTLEEATAGVNDALRYSVALKPQDFTVGLRGVLASLDDQGHVRIKSTNTFTKRRPTFKAVNVTLRSPKGALWEIQFHTPQTFALKEQFHVLYKRNHALQMKGAPLADQWELQAPAQEAFSRVALPPACEEIDDWETLGSDRKAALPAAEISHVSGASGTATSMSPKELQELRRRDAPEKVWKVEKLEQKVREACTAVGRPENVLSIAHWGDYKAAAPRLRAVGRTTEPEIAKSPEAKEIVAALGPRPIVLVGMPGAGKSSLGRALAKRLGLRFVDSDKEIEQKVGKSISEIFKDHGEDYFRRLEASEIAQLLKAGPKVVATGGGSVLAVQTRHLIGNKGVSIWFDTGLDVIQTRTRKDTKRPLLQGSDRDQKIAQLMSERRPLYQQADLRFVPPHKNDTKNADPCVKALHAYLCGKEAPGLGSAEQEADRLHVPGARDDAEQRAENTGDQATSSTQGVEVFTDPFAASRAGEIRPYALQEEQTGDADRQQEQGRDTGPDDAVDVVKILDPTRRVPMTRFSTNGEPNTAGWESDGRLTHHSRVAQTDEPGSGIAPQGRHPLGPTHWLTDYHITADYRLLDQELQGRSPDLAARTRLVNSVIAYHLRLIPEHEAPGAFQRIVHNQNEDDTGDFLFLPVNDGRAADPDSGSHWSLLLVDRRDRENPVGYHYDSLGAYHRTIATEFAARLGASLRPMRMARQQNGY
ncbi:shikimate kinase, partial [Rhizobium leguminosarum]|uniref:shikimate kinase n=1 Tax=Rhizobium leguminosarum TaxID=384 RepID=UPI0032B26C75